MRSGMSDQKTLHSTAEIIGMAVGRAGGSLQDNAMGGGVLGGSRVEVRLDGATANQSDVLLWVSIPWRAAMMMAEQAA